MNALQLPWVLKHERLVLAGILLLALTLRLTYVLQMRASPFFDDPQVDQRFFVDWGRAIAEGRSIGEGPLLRAPLYAWWLGLVFKVFGPGLLVPRLLQAGIGTAGVWLVYRLGKQAFDAVVGLVAALIAATYWILIYFDGEFLREPLLNPVNLMGISSSLAFAGRPSLRRGLTAGAMWGLSVLLRPQVLMFVPALAVWLAWHARVPRRLLLAFCGSVVVLIAPVTAYNWFVGHDLVLVSPEGGQALWIGNNPGADGVTGFAPGTRRDFWGYMEDGKARAEADEGHALKRSEVSRYYVRKTWRFFREQPARAIGLLVWKTRLVCTDWEFGSNPEEPRFFAERFAPIVRWLPITFGFVLSLAVLGLLLHLGSGLGARFPLWGFLTVYGATVVLFSVSARHRLPLVPIAVVYAAASAVWLLRAVLAQRWAPIAGGLLAWGLLWTGTHTVDPPKRASTANGLAWLGIEEARAGRLEGAVALFEESIALFPDACDTHTSLGVTLYSLGRETEAVRSLEQALRICPEDVQALDTLAEVRIRAGRFEEAQRLAERSIRAYPHLARGYYALGRTHFYSKRLEEAADAFRKALARNPESFNAAYSLGKTARLLGRNEEAIGEFARAVECRDGAEGESLLDAYTCEIELLLKAGRRTDARSFSTKMIERFPGNTRAMRIFNQL